MFPFLSSGTFLRVPAVAAAASSAADPPPSTSSPPFAVCGIAWDGCVTNRPGARFGPRGIREASLMLCDGLHSAFEESPCEVTVDVGDLELPNTSLVAMREAMVPRVVSLVQSRHMVWLGGDHSVTLPILRGYAASGKFRRSASGAPLACIHFDAHCDTWVDHFGEPSGHGTWVYEAIQEKLIIPECTFQLGIRSSGAKEAREYVQDVGGMIFTGRALRGRDGWAGLVKPVVERVVNRLREHGNPPVYMTFDIDCIDPAFAPGTGTPEPGGLTSAQALTLVEGFCALLGNQLVGFDVVEVAPPYDTAELTTSVAAHLVWTYLSAQACILKRGHEETRRLWEAKMQLPE